MRKVNLLKKYKYWILIALTFAWMTVIFINSALTGTISSGLSEAVINAMVVILKWFGDGGIATYFRNIIQSEGFHTFVRKAAHFIEFGILGLLIVGSLGIFPKIRHLYFKRAVLASGLGLAYAAGDEIHQLFVDGRVASVVDVMIDTAGVLLFATSMLYIIRARTIKDKSMETNINRR